MDHAVARAPQGDGGHRRLGRKVARERRLINVKPGDKVGLGDTYGLIRYGSRLDTYLPAGRVGLWTKSDAVSDFDDFEIEPSEASPSGPR